MVFNNDAGDGVGCQDRSMFLSNSFFGELFTADIHGGGRVRELFARIEYFTCWQPHIHNCSLSCIGRNIHDGCTV